MALNELDPQFCCNICGGQWDQENNRFIVRCGNPIPADIYLGKVCRFSDKTSESICLNPLKGDKQKMLESTWESMNSLHPKSEQVLKDLFISQESIDYLKKHGNTRYE